MNAEIIKQFVSNFMNHFQEIIKSQDPVAVTSLIIAIILALFQIHTFLKSSNIVTIPPVFIKIFPHQYGHMDYMSVYAELTFFNDTTSTDTEVIKNIDLELTIGSKKISFKDYEIGFMDDYEPNFEFQREILSSPFSIKAGEVVSRRIFFKPKGKVKLLSPVMEESSSYFDIFDFNTLLNKSDNFSVIFSAAGISGKIYNISCSGLIPEELKHKFENMVTNNQTETQYQGLTLACQ